MQNDNKTTLSGNATNRLNSDKELKAIVKNKHISMGKKVLQLSVEMLDFNIV